MINEIEQYNTQLANTNMVLDIVEQILAVASDLNATGEHLTQSLRGLTGAYAILLTIMSTKKPDSYKILAFNPERRKYLAETDIVKELIKQSKKLSKIKYFTLSNNSLRKGHDVEKNNTMIENAVVAPLINKNHHIGNLILLGLPNNEAGSTRSLKAITLLSNILAIVMRTALLYNKQDKLIIQLEKEVKERIHAEDELKNATSQLIQTEKLVSIGQLAAGVAHEVNSPLGAIKSSNESININFLDFFKLIQKQSHTMVRFKTLTDRIIKTINTGTHAYSSREIRQQKSEMLHNLEKHNIKNAYEIANLLTNAGIYNDYAEYIPLFDKNDNSEDIVFLQKFSTILQSSNIIDMAVKQSTKVVNALKNFARTGENSELTKINIKDTIETALTLYRNVLKHGIELKLNFEDVPTIYGYPDKLCQVWTNLIQNAAYAMGNNGKLEITLRQVKNLIQIIFTDSGTGIPADIIDRIFEPLFTTKQLGEGTGLGLDIVKQIIQDHNGCISVESEPGKGATFIIELPLNNQLKTV